MKSGRLTNLLLSVIALCLILMLLRDAARPGEAQQGGPAEVKIVGIDRGSGQWDTIYVREGR